MVGDAAAEIAKARRLALHPALAEEVQPRRQRAVLPARRLAGQLDRLHVGHHPAAAHQRLDRHAHLAGGLQRDIRVLGEPAQHLPVEDRRRRVARNADDPADRDLRLVGRLLVGRLLGGRLPGDAPVGEYTASVFLVSEGEVLATTSVPLTVGKTGFEQAVYSFAIDHGFAYGLLAVVIALASGWGVAAIMKR